MWYNSKVKINKGGNDMFLHYEFDEFGIEYDADINEVRRVLLECICEEVKGKYIADTPLGDMAEWLLCELGDDYFEERYEEYLLNEFEDDAQREYEEILEEERERKYLEQDYWRSQF